MGFSLLAITSLLATLFTALVCITFLSTATLGAVLVAATSLFSVAFFSSFRSAAVAFPTSSLSFTTGGIFSLTLLCLPATTLFLSTVFLAVPASLANTLLVPLLLSHIAFCFPTLCFSASLLLLVASVELVAEVPIATLVFFSIAALSFPLLLATLAVSLLAALGLPLVASFFGATSLRATLFFDPFLFADITLTFASGAASLFTIFLLFVATLFFTDVDLYFTATLCCSLVFVTTFSALFLRLFSTFLLALLLVAATYFTLLLSLLLAIAASPFLTSCVGSDIVADFATPISSILPLGSSPTLPTLAFAICTPLPFMLTPLLLPSLLLVFLLSSAGIPSGSCSTTSILFFLFLLTT